MEKYHQRTGLRDEGGRRRDSGEDRTLKLTAQETNFQDFLESLCWTNAECSGGAFSHFQR